MANAPSLADALAQLEAAANDCQSTVRAIRQLPGHAQQPFSMPLQQLAHDLYQLEVAMAQVASQALGRPLPTPHPEHAGSWASSVVRNVPGWRDVASRLPVNPAAFVAAQTIRQRAQAIGRSMSGASGHSAGMHMGTPVGGVPVAAMGGGLPPVPMGPPVSMAPQAPPPVEMMGAGGFAPMLSAGVATMGVAQAVPQSPAPAVPAAPSDFGRKVGGFFLSLASLIGTGFAARYAYKHDHGQVAPETQENERVKTQQVLDKESPGHTLDLLPTPGGGWIASVKNGKRSVARATATDPTEAMRQVLTDTIRRDTLGMELGGPGIEVVQGKGGGGEGTAIDPSGSARPEASAKRPRRRKVAPAGGEESEAEPDATPEASPAA